MSFFTTGAEAGGRQNEDLLGDGVDLSNALVVVDDRHRGLPHSERNRTGCKLDENN